MSRNVKTNVEFRRDVLDVFVHGATLYCYQCNVCTTECPVANTVGPDKYNPRRNILLAMSGLDYMIFGADADNFNVWGCTVCDTCDEKCPQKIELTAVFQLLKQVSVARGEAPSAILGQAKTVLEHGKAIPLMAAIERRRKAMNLPEPPRVAVEEVKTLLEAAGLPEVIAKAEKKEA
ncbi:MAG: hypothetical protein Kow0069_07620 [Promethearchaeota archaeon]